MAFAFLLFADWWLGRMFACEPMCTWFDFSDDLTMYCYIFQFVLLLLYRMIWYRTLLRTKHYSGIVVIDFSNFFSGTKHKGC